MGNSPNILLTPAAIIGQSKVKVTPGFSAISPVQSRIISDQHQFTLSSLPFLEAARPQNLILHLSSFQSHYNPLSSTSSLVVTIHTLQVEGIICKKNVIICRILFQSGQLIPTSKVRLRYELF